VSFLSFQEQFESRKFWKPPFFKRFLPLEQLPRALCEFEQPNAFLKVGLIRGLVFGNGAEHFALPGAPLWSLSPARYGRHMLTFISQLRHPILIIAIALIATVVITFVVILANKRKQSASA